MGRVRSTVTKINQRLNVKLAATIMASSTLLSSLLGFFRDQMCIRDRAMIADELRRLERQQAIRETDIDVALEIMRDVDRQWVLASLGARTRFQSILFPTGVDI